MNFFKIKKNKIPFGKPLIDFKEINSVTKVLKSGIYAHGPISNLFEKKFCSFTGAKFSTTVSSCTAGMHLFYFALGIGRGDEVIVPAQTHTATAHAVELSGAKPIFVDCEIETGNIDPKKIQEKITKKTKAICVVHFLGIPVDMKKINFIAKKNNLFVLEDCALSLGASYNKTHTGILGDAGVFSFYPAKHITTGEGGIIITKNKSLYNKIKLLKSLGINKTFLERKTPGIYDAVEVGFNYRMSEIHASIGVKQIEKINNFIKKRKRNFEFLKKKFRTNGELHIIDSTNI
jgi:dTDP-4-amino-4,6-dideoxygalactose transaminase